MPPLNSKKSEGDGSIQKDVEFVAKDDDDQVATGIVMVPDKVDLQNDFVREDQIEAFAEQFENFEEVGEAGGGIMHAVFPDDWLDLERNEVLDEAEEIGGQTAPAGAWVQSWSYNNDDLWQLVENGTFAGYSVGIDGVRWDGPFEQEDVEDVDVPPEIDEEELVWQIVDGIMREVSTVDIPAVPDAMILDKADEEKRLADHLGNRDAFIEEAIGRGHDEAAAEQMWDVLDEASEVEGAGEPGEKTWKERAKAFFSIGGPAGPDKSDTDSTAKEGRTLSKANQESAMAAVDANLDILEDAGVAHEMTRFTDKENVDFDLSEHDASAWSAAEDESEEEDEEEGDDDGDEEEDEEIENAAGGDTPDDTTDMSDNPDGGEEEKSLAEQNAEQISDLSDSVKDLTEAITGPEPDTAEIELDGETYEVREDAAKAVLGVGEDDDVAEAIERLNEKAGRVDEVEDRLDTIVEQSGAGSDQIRAAAGGEGEDESSKLDDVGKALS